MLKLLFTLLMSLMLTLTTFATASETLTSQVYVNDIISPTLADSTTSTKLAVQNSTVRVESTDVLGGLYVVMDAPFPIGGFAVTEGESVIEVNNGFIHNYIELSGTDNTVTLTFAEKAVVTDVYALGVGEVPDFVQQWEEPLEACDILLLPTHADDEHLFMGGVAPTYIDRGLTVQVAYMVNHNTEPYRPHELLNGLWEAGVTNYPVIPHFGDYYSESLAHAETIYPRDEIIDYQVGLLRQFTPKIVIAHDFAGEYGHGAHMLNTDCLTEAVHLAADSEYIHENGREVWDTDKIYVHLYDENSILLDVDTPLESYGGRTAFEVAKDAYAKHLSQHWTYFSVTTDGAHNIREYGLYYSKVGLDSGNDMTENITTHAEDEAAELALIKAEEEAKKAAEAEAARLAAEQKAALEAAKAEVAPTPTPTTTENKGVNTMILVGVTALGGVAIVAVVMVLQARTRNRR